MTKQTNHSPGGVRIRLTSIAATCPAQQTNHTFSPISRERGKETQGRKVRVSVVPDSLEKKPLLPPGSSRVEEEKIS